MRALIQRVSEASVIVSDEKISGIGCGLVIFLGIFNDDDIQDIEYLIKKTAGLRIFNDDDDNMNFSIQDVNASALVVSQFTLCANTQKGRRPSFFNAASPKIAETMYENYCAGLEQVGISVNRGRFGATMCVQIKNEGPVTIMLDSKLIK